MRVMHAIATTLIKSITPTANQEAEERRKYRKGEYEYKGNLILMHCLQIFCTEV